MQDAQNPATKKQPKRNRRSAVNAAALAIVGAAVIGTVAFAATDKGPAEEPDPPFSAPIVTPPPGADPKCVVPPDDGSKLWVSEDVLDEVTTKLDEELTKRFGEPGPLPVRRLDNGLIGQPVDYVGHRVVVVVDAAKLDPDALEAELQPLAVPTVPIEVQGSCRSSDEIKRAMEALDKKDWHLASELDGSYNIDDYSSTVAFTAVAGPALDSLRSHLAGLNLSDVVVITEGKVALD